MVRVRSSNNASKSQNLFTKFKLTMIQKSLSTRRLNSRNLARFRLQKKTVPEIISTKNLVSINFSAKSKKQDLTSMKGLKIWKSKMSQNRVISISKTSKVRTFSIRPKTKMMLSKPKKLNWWLKLSNLKVKWCRSSKPRSTQFCANLNNNCKEMLS